jgi:hypothetical protein
MDGWITVAAAGVATEHELACWVRRAVNHVKWLPPK